MARSASDTVRHMQYLLRGTGFVSTLRQTARKVFSPIVESDAAYIAIRYFDRESNSSPSEFAKEEDGTTAAVYERSADLDGVGASDSDAELVSEAREYLEQGPNRIAIVAQRYRPGDDGYKLVGYRTLVRGEYSYWDDRLTGSMPQDCIFATNVYVAPEHRGERVFIAMRQAMERYCRERGITKVVGFIKVHNRPSILAHKHNSKGGVGTLNGIVRRTTFLSGLHERITATDTIHAIIDGPMPSPEQDLFRP